MLLNHEMEIFLTVVVQKLLSANSIYTVLYTSEKNNVQQQKWPFDMLVQVRKPGLWACQYLLPDQLIQGLQDFYRLPGSPGEGTSK